mmetsp:Transcript_13286/g.24538  ORF Transcript_13286/g.24538 Transcript_13286/m.24538 type:complete len:602 (-) Transcript_13286:131-1936(-)
MPRHVLTHHDEESGLHPPPGTRHSNNNSNIDRYRDKKKKTKRKGVYKSSWFSTIFIGCVCFVVVYSIRQMYHHFPSSRGSGSDSGSNAGERTGYNNDDVVKTVISNEEEDARVAESIRKHAEEQQQYEQSQRDNTFTSSGQRLQPSTHSFWWVLWHLRDYFDLQPLRNVLIRAGIFSAPAPETPTYSSLHEGDFGGDSSKGVFQIDTNSELSDVQKSVRVAEMTEHIASLLQASKAQPTDNSTAAVDAGCDPQAAGARYSAYFSALSRIYARAGNIQETCVPQYQACGWPRGDTNRGPDHDQQRPLPLLVVAIGGEGSGHHTWSNLMDGVVDCILTETNQFKYRLIKKKATPSADNKKQRGRNKDKVFLTEKVLEGFPHLTAEELGQHMHQQVPPNCRTSFDALDSFPYGVTESRGRQMNHPDLVNLQQLDGIAFRLKYLVLVRNATDSTMSALGRRFVKNVDAAVRTVEMSLAYMDAALRGVPCHKTLIAYFEHVKARPADIVAPLAQFLELDDRGAQVLKSKLFAMSSRSFSKRTYDYDYLGLCKGLQGMACNDRVRMHINDFLERRAYMWPTFAGHGRAAEGADSVVSAAVSAGSAGA